MKPQKAVAMVKDANILVHTVGPSEFTAWNSLITALEWAKYGCCSRGYKEDKQAAGYSVQEVLIVPADSVVMPAECPEAVIEAAAQFVMDIHPTKATFNELYDAMRTALLEDQSNG